MDSFLNQYGQFIKETNLLSAGGSASVFNYGKDHVLKVCSKGIRYFSHFSATASARDFAKHINSLSEYFLPVEEILYEDDFMFAYSQKRVQILTNHDINKQVVLDVFKFVKFMLENDTIVSDLAAHNLTVHNGHAVVFDYHGLHRLKVVNGTIKRSDWWQRIARNLTRFITSLYIPDKRSNFSVLMQDCDDFAIAQLKKQSSLPPAFVELIEHMYVNKEASSISTICTLLDACIVDINRKSKFNVSKKRKRLHRQYHKIRDAKKELGASKKDMGVFKEPKKDAAPNKKDSSPKEHKKESKKNK